MRCKNIMVGTLFIALLTACGDPEPVSTGTKAPGINRSTGNQQPGTAPITGDATKGQTALTSNCNVCHGKSAHALGKNDVGLMKDAGGKSYHTSIAKVFTDSGNDITAYLATQ